MRKEAKEKGWVRGGRQGAVRFSRAVTVTMPGLGGIRGGVLVLQWEEGGAWL